VVANVSRRSAESHCARAHTEDAAAGRPRADRQRRAGSVQPATLGHEVLAPRSSRLIAAPALGHCPHEGVEPLPAELLSVVLERYRRLPERFQWCPASGCGLIWYRFPLSGRLEALGVLREGRIDFAPDRAGDR